MRVRQAVAALPDHPLSFFTEWGSRSSHAVRLAAVEGASWVPVIDPYVPTTAMVLPADLAVDLARFATARMDSTDPDDVVLLRFVRERGLTPYISVPNLAEHAASGSLIGNNLLLGPRRSALFAGLLDRTPPMDDRVSGQTVVPHLLMLEGYSVCHLRDEPTGAQWHTVRTHEYLAQVLGLSLPALTTGFAGAIGRLDRSGRMRTRVSEPLLFQVWLTAFGYGVALASFAPDLSTLDMMLATPSPSVGLDTFGPGTLKRFVPAGHLRLLPELLRPLLLDAIRAGYSAVHDTTQAGGPVRDGGRSDGSAHNAARTGVRVS